MIKAVNIKWDIDDNDDDYEYLPTEIDIPDGMTDDNEISDYISNYIGYCHQGFDLKNV